MTCTDNGRAEQMEDRCTLRTHRMQNFAGLDQGWKNLGFLEKSL